MTGRQTKSQSDATPARRPWLDHRCGPARVRSSSESGSRSGIRRRVQPVVDEPVVTDDAATRQDNSGFALGTRPRSRGRRAALQPPGPSRSRAGLRAATSRPSRTSRRSANEPVQRTSGLAAGKRVSAARTCPDPFEYRPVRAGGPSNERGAGPIEQNARSTSTGSPSPRRRRQLSAVCSCSERASGWRSPGEIPPATATRTRPTLHLGRWHRSFLPRAEKEEDAAKKADAKSCRSKCKERSPLKTRASLSISKRLPTTPNRRIPRRSWAGRTNGRISRLGSPISGTRMRRPIPDGGRRTQNDDGRPRRQRPRRASPSLAAAIEELPEQGGMIELQGPGPFLLPPIKIANRRRVIITGARAKSALRSSGSTVTAESKSGTEDEARP